MFPISKGELLRRLARGVAEFCPSLQNHFICPTCLTSIALPGKGLISQAHIIPKAAGGVLKTLLCRRCNSSFGSRQDKWFGEMARLKTQGGDPLSTAIRKRFFDLDGMRVNGRWKSDESGTLKFIIDAHRNSPRINRMLAEHFRRKPPRITVGVPLPILESRALVDVGLLTAGYLMWFALAGYSWVFQQHLDSVREQILNPDSKIIPNGGVAYANGTISPQPTLGAVRIDGHLAVSMFYQNAIVVFPLADCPTLYENFPSGFEGKSTTTLWKMRFNEPVYEERLSFAIKDRVETRIFINPDKGERSEASPGGDLLLLFVEGEPRSRLLHPVTQEEFEEREKAGGLVIRIGEQE